MVPIGLAASFGYERRFVHEAARGSQWDFLVDQASTASRTYSTVRARPECGHRYAQRSVHHPPMGVIGHTLSQWIRAQCLVVGSRSKELLRNIVFNVRLGFNV